jgi:sec-independent protein translocase protein TatA
MPNLGPTELIIILLIIVVLFGVGRIGKIGGELGKGIRSFREGMKGDEETPEKKDKEKEETKQETKEEDTTKQ